MSSWRFAMVADAASRGLGDWLNIELKRESDRLEKQWQLTLEAQREANAQARAEMQMKHAENLAETREKAATERHADTMSAREEEAKATARFRSDQLSAREKEFNKTRVDDARKTLQKTLLEYDEAMRKELENPMIQMDEKAKEGILSRYQGLKDQAITGTVAWLSSEGLPGYEVDSEQELQSLLIQNGMDLPGAKQHSKQIWGQITGVGEEYPDIGGGPHPRDNPQGWFYDDRGYDLPQGVQRSAGVVGQGPLFDEEVARRSGAAAPQAQPPAAGAPSIAPPQIQAPGGVEPLFPGQAADPNQPQPWDRTRAFGREVGRRFDQIPQQGNRYGGPKGWEWMGGMGNR